MRVGVYNEEDGLALNGSMVVTYDSEGNEKAMTEVKSQCIDFQSCGDVAVVAKPVKKKTHYLQVEMLNFQVIL